MKQIVVPGDSLGSRILIVSLNIQLFRGIYCYFHAADVIFFFVCSYVIVICAKLSLVGEKLPLVAK